LSYDEAEKLIQLGEQFGCTKSLEWFRFYSRKSFKAGGWVGVINLGRAQITVYPKINDDKEIDLIKLLIGAGWIEDETYGQAKLETQSNFIDIFADWYNRRLQREALHGLPHSYVSQMDALGTLRGRLNLGRQIMAIARGQATLECDFDTFDANTLLNQTLKAGLRAAISLCSDSQLSRKLRSTVKLLDNVSDKIITPEVANQVKLRRNEIKTFQPLLSLAKLFLQRKSPKIEGDSQGGQAFGLMFSMWQLFEEYGLNTINKSLSKIIDPTGATYFAKGQEKERYLGSYIDKGEIKNDFQIRPDIIIYKKTDSKSKPLPVYVADTKWKDPEDNKGNLKVKSADAYQLFVYSHIYTNKDSHPLELALLYPQAGNSDGDLTGNSSPENLLGALGKPKQTFYLDAENNEVFNQNRLGGIPLNIFYFPLPTLSK
jgi:5-methylcytosine-specific restriction endonuclease McrBC regulatory subunit McrC